MHPRSRLRCLEGCGVTRTRSSTDIVQRKLGYSRVELEEERERLANATSSAENGNPRKLAIGLQSVLESIRPGARLQSVRSVELLTFLAEAEKARRWILEAMNIVCEWKGVVAWKGDDRSERRERVEGLRCRGCSAERQIEALGSRLRFGYGGVGGLFGISFRKKWCSN